MSPSARLRDLLGRYLVAVAEDGDAIAEHPHLLQPVRDEDDGAALVAKPARDGEERLDLLRRQRRGRLVHDDQPAVRRQRAGDLDHLLIGDRQAPHRLGHVDPDAEQLHQPPRIARHLRPRHAAKRRATGAAEHEVLGNRQVGERDRLLVDQRDAEFLRGDRGRYLDRRAVESESASRGTVHAGEDFREGRLARAVLAEERMDLAALQIEIDVAQHLDARELLGDAARRDERRIGERGGRLGHAQRPAGTGESGSISFCALRSDQKAAGIGASTRGDVLRHLARLGRSGDHRDHDRMGEHELQRRGGKGHVVGLAHCLDAADLGLDLRRGLAIGVVRGAGRAGDKNARGERRADDHRDAALLKAGHAAMQARLVEQRVGHGDEAEIEVGARRGILEGLVVVDAHAIGLDVARLLSVPAAP